MLSIKFISENSDIVVSRLKIKNFDAQDLVEQLIVLDTRRRKLQSELDARQAIINKLSKEIGRYYKQGKPEEAEKTKEQTTALKEEIKQLAPGMGEIEESIREFLVQLPNLPHETVPPGTSPQDNPVVREGGRKPLLGKDALPHWELARKYDIIDFESGNKITGAGFPLYKGRGAKLQRALINFFLETAVESGYTEFMPPVAVNEASAFGTGQLPDKEGQMYHITLDNLYLIPTAEVPLTNIFRGEIVSYKDLPLMLTAYTPCFRREAGSYGKDVKGLNRLHQFDKVEIV